MNQLYIYDSYAKGFNNEILHFDVVLTIKNDELADQYARQWLAALGLCANELQQCQYCHVEPLAQQLSEKQKNMLSEKHFCIIPLQGFEQL